jgi:hypothetical protein
MITIDWAKVTGAIGTITGVIALTIGFFNYRRVSKLKSLDLRLELRKAINVLANSVSQGIALIDRADASRKAASAATGMFHSGAMVKWTAGVTADKSELSQVQAEVPKTEETFQNLGASELESKLIEVHRLQGKIDNIRNKYESALRADDQTRIQIHADNRAMVERKLRQSDVHRP